jgi:hypothetical protein
MTAAVRETVHARKGDQNAVGGHLGLGAELAVKPREIVAADGVRLARPQALLDKIAQVVSIERDRLWFFLLLDLRQIKFSEFAERQADALCLT